jgi:hypothetical protein
MKKKNVTKSLSALPAEPDSVNGASTASGDVKAQRAAAEQPASAPLPPPPHAPRDAGRWDPQPWPRGGLNE